MVSHTAASVCQLRRIGPLALMAGFLAAGLMTAGLMTAGGHAVAGPGPLDPNAATVTAFQNGRSRASEASILPGAQQFVYKTVGDVQLKAWVYQPSSAATAPRPAVVFFFGGGWKNGSPQQFRSQCEYLQSRGIVAITCDYRVASRHDVKAVACVEDAKSAIRWVRSQAEQLTVDPARIAAAGGSAGGHLAACTGTLSQYDHPDEDHSVSSQPNAMLLMNPALVLAPLEGMEPSSWSDEKFQELAPRLGVSPSSLSPAHQVKPGQAPTLILHGDSDTTVPAETAAAFRDAMITAGNRCELVLFAGAPHGFFNLRGTGSPSETAGNDSQQADDHTQWHLRTLLHMDRFLQSLGWLEGPAIVPVVDNHNVRVRGSLQNSLAALQQSKQAHVAFLGGSITEMNGYRPLLENWLSHKFPDASLKFTNAGIASTCSHTGAFRLNRDILQQGPVDLLLLEFAVNDDQDAHHSETNCLLGMEGILRQVRRHNPRADIVMVHFVNPEMIELLQNGTQPVSSRQHERLARYYGISSVYLAKEVTERIAQQRLTWEEFGGTHPGPAGNQLAADLVTQVLTAGWQHEASANADDDRQALSPVNHPLPSRMLQPGAFHQGRLVPHHELRIASGWRVGRPDWKSIGGSFRDRFSADEFVFAHEPGAELSLDFQGDAVGVYVLAGPDAGQLEFQLDGGTWETAELFHSYSASLHYPRTVMLASRLSAGAHTVRVRTSNHHHPASSGHAARILAFVVNGPLPAAAEPVASAQ